MYLICQIKEPSKKIREARQGRVSRPNLEGEKVTIVLRHSNGEEKCQFSKGVFFQVHIYNDTICCFKGGVWLHFGPKFVIDCRYYKTPAI